MATNPSFVLFLLITFAFDNKCGLAQSAAHVKTQNVGMGPNSTKPLFCN